MNDRHKTHADLMPRHVCPSLLMKHIVTHGLAEPIYDDRVDPGDGYYWCARTCRPVGPDDELVFPRACVPGRSCFAGPQT